MRKGEKEGERKGERKGRREGGQLRVGLAVAWLSLVICTSAHPFKKFWEEVWQWNAKQDIETWLTISLAELLARITCMYANENGKQNIDTISLVELTSLFLSYKHKCTVNIT